MGLVTYASKPAATIRSRSGRMALAVTAITGMWLKTGDGGGSHQRSETVLDRHFEIEQDQVGVGLRHALQGFLAVAGLDDAIVGAFENIADQFPAQPVIFGYQECTHSSYLALGGHGALDARRTQREEKAAPLTQAAFDPDSSRRATPPAAG